MSWAERALTMRVSTWIAVAIKSLRLLLVILLAQVRLDRAAAQHRRWAIDVLDTFGIDVRSDDRAQLDPNTGGVLYVNLNQQTLLAPVLYQFIVPARCRWIINVEFAALPLVGWAFVSRGAVTIMRQRPEQAKAAMARVVQDLRRGDVFGVSIEGRRTLDGRLSPFKNGPVVTAIQAQCDIVPFMTFGEYELWPHGRVASTSGNHRCDHLSLHSGSRADLRGSGSARS